MSRVVLATIVVTAATAAACGNGSNSPDAAVDADYGDALNPIGSFDPGFTNTSPNNPLSIEVTISGETLGENGLPFSPVNPGDPQFVDGWNVSFDRYLIVIGNVRVTPGATQYVDQQTLNGIAAHKDGPYVIDVHALSTAGFNGFVGADGEEPAAGIFKWDHQDNGDAFDSGTLYAFSYDSVPATYPATQVNLTADDIALYDTMVANHWNKYVEGHATFVAAGSFPDAAIQQNFATLAGGTVGSDGAPLTAPSVHFVFGWNDATSSINCINPFNGNMDEANLDNRGIQPTTDGAQIAQITIHTDHVFWDKLKQEGTPLRMDPIAAWAGSDTEAAPLDLATLADKPLATTFADGTPLPDRSPFLVNPAGTQISDQTNPNQVTLDVGGVPASDLTGLSAFMAFSGQSQTHLNANGLCYIDGQNAADPFYKPAIAPAPTQ